MQTCQEGRESGLEHCFPAKETQTSGFSISKSSILAEDITKCPKMMEAAGKT